MLKKGSDLKHVQLFKILRADLKHYDHEYKEGLNVLKGTFSPSGDCKPGGLYVTSQPHLWTEYGDLISPVTLPEDAQVWITPGTDKYKVDKLILGKWAEISEDVYLKAVQCNSWVLENIAYDKRTYPICLSAVHFDGRCLPLVPSSHLTLEMCLAAVRSVGWSLCFVPPKHRTYEVCLEAIRRDRSVLRFIPFEHRTLEVLSDADSQRYIPYDSEWHGYDYLMHKH